MSIAVFVAIAIALAASPVPAGTRARPDAPARATPPDVATSGFFPDWTSLSPNFYPLLPTAVSQPVLGPADVTDAHASFLADPFLIHDGAAWYLFFEVTVPLGKIALATSMDGLHWTYQHIVLAENFQLSFPNVFRYDGVYYMTPESTAKLSVRLYRATSFPDSWEYVTDLVHGRDYADPSVYRFQDRWWMFVGNGRSDSCFVFYSDSLRSGWSEHPQSPIVAGNRGRARPGGRGMLLSGDRLFRLTQNDTPTYGRALRVFQVDQLTPVTYAEHEIPESPLVQASGSGWNRDGMHTCDPWWVGDRWLAAVDGDSAGVWRIGIYTSPTIAGLEPGPPQQADWPHVRCAPNPFRTSTQIRCDISAAQPGLGGRVTIYDSSGRFLVSPVLPAAPAGAATLAWDGTDAGGRPLPAGVYFCRLILGDLAATTRVVLLR
jgi:hypothetical protein